MSKLLYLSGEDFRVIVGPNGPTMCNRIKGFSLVLFYSKKCVHCHTFIPIFKRIPSLISGCHFGLVNVTQNVNLIKLSESTISPIKFVPYVLLYVNGKPFLRYDGPRSEIGVKKFIIDVSKKLNNKQYFSNMQNKQRTVKKDDKIPPYCIAKPKCDGDVCYLAYDKAYK